MRTTAMLRRMGVCLPACFLFSALGLEAQSVPPTAVNLQLPALSTSATTNVTSPIHFQATAESGYQITGYVVYVDNNIAYKQQGATLDGWVVVPSGAHQVHITAWDSSGGSSNYLTIPSQGSNYSIDVTGFAPPTPPASAVQINIDHNTSYSWAVQPNAGGNCATGTIVSPWTSSSDPNTVNAPDPTGGEHFNETGCGSEDNTLFAWKDNDSTTVTNARTNFLWDYWFYVPSSDNNANIQALESDMFIALPINGVVQEFMFGTQCVYNGTAPEDYYQLAYPQDNDWASTSLSCEPPFSGAKAPFAKGQWHHATLFLQRVTTQGGTVPAYQDIVSSPSSSNDPDTQGLYATLTIDGNTAYLGHVTNTETPGWSPVIGVQHQIDMPGSAGSNTINEYVDNETLWTW